MSYRHFTRCTLPREHAALASLFVYGGAGLIGTLAVELILFFVVGSATGVGTGGLRFSTLVIPPLAGGALLASYGWLYDRLLCNDAEDRCALGMLLSVERPHPWEPTLEATVEGFDTDWTLNVLLAPGVDGEDQKKAESGPQGELVSQHPSVAAQGFRWAGHPSKRRPGDPDTAVLHCEFEGAGMVRLGQTTRIVLPLSLAAVALAVTGTPTSIWVAVAAAAPTLFLAGVAYCYADKRHRSGAQHTGAFSWVRRPDILVVKGAWIYDTAHDGWNEIHPIKHCQRVGTFKGEWPPDWKDTLDRWRIAIDDAERTAASAQAGSTWLIHPSVDG